MKAWVTNAISNSRWISKWYAVASCVALIALAATAPPIHAQATASDHATFDHSAFDSLLHRYVVNGMVDYDAFKRSPEFVAYLQRLAHVDPSTLPEADRLAFWINAYNAYTIELINEHDERGSIRNINRTLGFLTLHGPWSEPLATVGGHHYTLDDIEQRIIRPTFHEPRIHFALVCAAMGCPPLRSEAYTGAALDQQLDDQARIFLLDSPSKNRVDITGRKVYVSMIFNHYKEDFGGTDASVGRYIARFYPAGPARQLLESGNIELIETPYDWALNSQANAAHRQRRAFRESAEASRPARHQARPTNRIVDYLPWRSLEASSGPAGPDSGCGRWWPRRISASSRFASRVTTTMTATVATTPAFLLAAGILSACSGRQDHATDTAKAAMAGTTPAAAAGSGAGTMPSMASMQSDTTASRTWIKRALTVSRHCSLGTNRSWKRSSRTART